MVARPRLRSAAAAFCLLLGVVSGAPPAAADTRATLDRDRIHADETVRLVIQTDGQDQGAQPDLRALEANFELLSSSSQRNISITNGQQQSSRQWLIELAPKTTGSIVIAPIRVGAAVTNPLTLTVLPPRNQTATDGQPVFVEVDVMPRQAYVQQQIDLIIKLYVAITGQITGTLSEPQHNDVNVQRIGADTQYGQTRQGQQYRIIERRYVLFAQKSGLIPLPPIRFEGRLQSSGQSNQGAFNNLFNQGQPIRARSGAIRLDVLPPNPQYTGSPWLPAEQLQITELAQPSAPSDITVGQPINRQIRLRADGLTAEQLPEISLPASAQYKAYADRPERTTTTDNGKMAAQLTQSFALIPTRAGTLTLPEIKIDWWDTRENRQRTAVLPAQQITVSPAVAAPQPGQTATPADPALTAAGADGEQPVSTAAGNAQRRWQLVSAVLLALWLATLAILAPRWRRRSQRAPPAADPRPGQPDAGQALKALRQACTGGQPAKIRRALLHWAAATWPRTAPQTLSDITALTTEAALNDHIRQLDAALYASHDSDWSAGRLWQLVNDYARRHAADQAAPEPAAAAGLPALYPL